MDYESKSKSLAEKMNKITEKFNLSEELVTTGDDIIDLVKEKTEIIDLDDADELSNTLIPYKEIVNLKNMVDDFQYIRKVLKETTNNGRRVLNSVTLDLLNIDDDKRDQLIISFAELNKSVGDNMKLYMQSYKDISTVLLNIDKIKKDQNENDDKNVTNNLTINTCEKISTIDLIEQLRNK